MIETADLLMVVICDGDNRHCPEYFKLNLSVGGKQDLDVFQTVRNCANQAGWNIDGKDLCPKCLEKI